jgi:hypothetical protein
MRRARLARGDKPGRCRSMLARRKTAHEAFSFLEFLSHLNFPSGVKIN